MHAVRTASPFFSTTTDSCHFSLGDYEGWIFKDGPYASGSLQSFAAINASSSEITAVLDSARTLPDRVTVEGSTMLLRRGREVILIDPGCGTTLGKRRGLAIGKIAAAGFSPEDITVILLTHLHLDHIGGALNDERKAPRFPNARILVCEDEVAFWRSSSPDLSQSAWSGDTQVNTALAIQAAIGVLEEQLELFSAGERLFEEMASLPLPGHTPGHVGYRLRSRHEEIIAIGDTLIDPILHVRRPQWIGPTDLRPAMLVETRRTLLRLAARERNRLFGFHFPFPGFGYVTERETEVYDFTPHQAAFAGIET